MIWMQTQPNKVNTDFILVIATFVYEFVSFGTVVSKEIKTHQNKDYQVLIIQRIRTPRSYFTGELRFPLS